MRYQLPRSDRKPHPSNGTRPSRSRASRGSVLGPTGFAFSAFLLLIGLSATVSGASTRAAGDRSPSFATQLLPSTPAVPPACTWSYPGSPGSPGSSDNVCIKSGTYRVSTGAPTWNSANISSGAELEVGTDAEPCGSKAITLTLTGGGSVSGTIVMESSSTCASGGNTKIDVGPGASLTNSGVVQTCRCGGGSRYLEGSITNTSTGKLTVDGITYLQGPGTFTNDGAVSMNYTAKNEGQLSVSGGLHFLNNSGGSVNGDGTNAQLLIGGGNTLQEAGTISGTAAVLNGSNLDYTGSGASDIILEGTATLTGAMAADQTLQLQGGSSLSISVQGNFINAGTMNFDSGSGTANLAIARGSMLKNKGTLEASGNEWATVTGKLDNTGEVLCGAAVHVAIDDLTNYASKTKSMNGGTYTSSSGCLLVLSGMPVVTAKAGFDLLGGQMTTGVAATNVLAGLRTIGASGSLELTNGEVLDTSGPLSNSGSVVIGTVGTFDGGTLNAGGTYTESAGATIVEDPAAALSASSVNVTGGFLGGVGTIYGSVHLTGGNLEAGSKAGTGLLSVSGALNIGAHGSLSEVLAGTSAGSQFDQIDVAGSTLVGGTLEVSTAKAFVPKRSQTFHIVVTVVASGSFSTIHGNGVGYGVTVGKKGVALTVNDVATATAAKLSAATVSEHGSVTYGATVTAAAGGTPTGSVTFSSGTVTLCTGALSGGKTSCKASNAPVGFDSVVATYNGAPGFETSAGAAKLTVVGPASKLVMTSGPPSSSVAGASFSVRVSEEDANSNVEIGDNSTSVTLTLAANPGASKLSCNKGGTTVTVSKGVASFTCSLNKVGTGYILKATSSPAHGAVTSDAFDVTVGAASKLVISSQPASSSKAGASFLVGVSVEDAQGNVEAGDSSTSVTLAIGTNPGGSKLTCTNSGGTTVTVSHGVAGFDCSLNLAAAGYTLKATSSPAHGTATSGSFDITPAAATQLVFTTEPPANPGAGASFTVAVSVEDAEGNVETGDHSTTVTLAIGANPGGSTLTCTGGPTATVTGGVASFDCSLNVDGAGYTLAATSSPAHGTAKSHAFNIGTGPATQLVFTTQPLSSKSGSSFTVGVSVEDADGNVETGDNSTTVTLAIGVNPGGSKLTCTNKGWTTVTVSSGVASFKCSLDIAGAGYTLTAASSPTYSAATSGAFDITPGAATQLVFTTQPPAASGAGAGFAVGVSVEDADGNLVASDNSTTVTLAIGTNPGGSKLVCTGGPTATVSSGVASFECSLNVVGSGYTLAASSVPDLGTATSTAFDITPGPATQLVFTTQPPASSEAGASFSVGVSIEDADGNVETADNSTTVTLAIGNNPGGSKLTCTGGTTATVSSGVASFTCSLNLVGTGYTLTATSSPVHPMATSTGFDITPGPATQLVFTTQPPGSSEAGSSFSVGVSVEDAEGNIETGDNTTSVTLAIGTNPGGSKLTCTGGTTATVSSGVASFTCSLNLVGTGYTLTATSSPVHPMATSTGFDITPGPATQLVFTTQPAASSTAAAGFSVGVSVEDAEGNIETGDNTTSVTLAIGTNPGGSALTCTNTGGATVTVSSGVADFTCSLNLVGTGYTLTATSSPVHPMATSTGFDITPGPATQLVFTTQPPGSSTAAAGFSVGVSVEDAEGNIETGDNTTSVTLAIGTNPGGSALTCTNTGGATVTVSSGVADFMCSLNLVGTGYTLTATSSPVHPMATSTAFDITPGSATQLVFTTQPPGTSAAAAGFPVEVSVEDAEGNVETADNSTMVALAIGTNPGGSTLNCTNTGGATVTVTSGAADFTCSLNLVGTGYTLTATSSPVHPMATSSAFDITPGPATQLVFTTEPAASSVAAVGFPVEVSVEDAEGNVETADNSTTVTLAMGNNPGGSTLTCTNTGGATVTVTSGVASFDCSLNLVGTGYTLTATSSPVYPMATSTGFDITPGTATQLVFTVQPLSSGAGVSFSVQVSEEDAEGNVVTGDDTTTVSLAIGNNPGGSTLTCTNTGGTTVTVSSGVADFTCSLDQVGTGYTLTATSVPDLGTATSAAFDIT